MQDNNLNYSFTLGYYFCTSVGKPFKIMIMNNGSSKYDINRIAEIKVSYDPGSKSTDRIKINCSANANQVFRSIWNWDAMDFQEEFLAIYLNRGNQILGVYKHSKGTESACLVSIKQILAVGLKSNASSFILAHNHPSSSLVPSRQDQELTKKIKAAADICDLKFLDHLIIRKEEGYYSFADEGII